MSKHPSSTRRESFLRYLSCGRGTSVVRHDDLWMALRTHLKTRTRGSMQAFSCFLCFGFRALLSSMSYFCVAAIFFNLWLCQGGRAQGLRLVCQMVARSMFFSSFEFATSLICIIPVSVSCLRSIFFDSLSSIMSE